MTTDIKEERVPRLIYLCKEHVVALNNIKKEVENILDTLATARQTNPKGDEFQVAVAKYWALRGALKRFRPALNTLIRTASQALEYSEADELDRLELTVLAAELEAASEQIDTLMSSLGSLTNK